MTATHKHASRRRLDLSSVILLLLGIVSGVGAYFLILNGMNALILTPAVVAATVGVIGLFKYEAPRD